MPRSESDGAADTAGQVLTGVAAAPGLAIGRLHRLDGSGARAGRDAGTPEQERAALDAAIAEARAQLETLSAQADELAAEILGFQIALLADPELLEPAETALAGGQPAEAAWGAALEPMIADYAGDPDDYFRARADDLRDLRDRVLRALSGASPGAAGIPEGAIIAAEELTPSRFLEIDWRRAQGLALAHGSASSHMAMLARARGVPMLTGLGNSLAGLTGGTEVILDAEDGRVIVRPDAATVEDYRQRLDSRRRTAATRAAYAAQPAATADGTPVRVLINVDDPRVLAEVDPACCDGIGLTRTEFLFRGDHDGLPDEDTQLRAYAEILRWAQGRSVTIRTLDAGGDKPVPGLTPAAESNPFLGLRGLRLSLARPEVFRVQLRALARAAVDGHLKVMLPMVTRPEELAQARALLDQAMDELARAGVDATRPELGIMVETPAAALDVARFDAAFYSIGSNDLVQYVTAAARDIPAVSALQDPLQPAVLELIGRVARTGAAQGAEVSLCGEMAARPDCIPALLDAGIRVLSVPPAAVGAAKQAVAQHRLGGDPGSQTDGA